METYRRMFKVFENFLLPYSKVAFRHEYFIMLACWLLQSVAIDLIIQKISRAQLYRNPQVESGWRANAIIIWRNLNGTLLGEIQWSMDRASTLDTRSIARSLTFHSIIHQVALTKSERAQFFIGESPAASTWQ